MKKRKVILLVLLSLTIVTGCSQNNNSNNTEDDNINNQINEENKDWGITDHFSAYANNKITGFNINFPSNAGIPKGTGLVAEQTDGSFVFVDAHLVDETPNIESLEVVLPTCFTQTELTMKLYRGLSYGNFKFEITSKKKTTINGYEMYKYTGIHSFTYDGNKQTMNFVAYSAQLKTNGAYVYWMVLDETDDQSLSKTIDSHAYNMALSLREE